VQLAGRPVETDPSPGSWIAAALAPAEPHTVAAVVPAVFPAYARLPHPAVRYAEDDDLPVTWSEVAAHNDRIAHRLMQWPAVTGSWDFVAEADQPELWNDAPAEGHLPAEVAQRLIDVLARHTATPEEIWFALWDGHLDTGDLPLLPVGNRCFLLVRGPLRLAAANFVPEPAEQSANLWWPADRSWCVGTDTDLMSTYVGGSAATVAALLAADGLEACPAEPTDPVTPDSDAVNPPPD
jgi:hypothetical protein